MQGNNPQFATVTFISADDTPGSTFRVPITHETTVRQLAKDAMQRLVLSRRSAGCKQTPSIMVTEVFVGDGAAGQPKAEVFSQDLVMQVVLVKEEVIFMRLQSSGESHPQPAPAPVPREAAPAVGSVAAAAPATAGAGCVPAAAPTTTATVRSEQPTHAPSKSASANVAAVAPPTEKLGTPPVADRATRATKRGRQDVSPEEDSTIQRLRAEEEAKRLRWGPKASSSFASNYVSSPNRLMSRRKPTKNVSGKTSTTTSPTKRARKEVPGKEVTVVADAAEKTGDAESFTREGWGPEAYKNFAANYVASPDRLARIIRQQQRAQKAAVKKEGEDKPSSGAKSMGSCKSARTGAIASSAAAVAPKRTVSRQLAFPESEDARESRQTVGHGVTLIEDEDDTPATPPPKGWGAEATKYFDSKTYCDDPSKARLTEEERSRPMQTRHSCRL